MALVAIFADKFIGHALREQRMHFNISEGMLNIGLILIRENGKGKEELPGITSFNGDLFFGLAN